MAALAWARSNELPPPTAERARTSYIAVVHAGLGDTAAAVRWLELGYDERDVHMVFLGADPKWDALRQDTGFSRIVDRLGLPGVSALAARATR